MIAVTGFEMIATSKAAVETLLGKEGSTKRQSYVKIGKET